MRCYKDLHPPVAGSNAVQVQVLYTLFDARSYSIYSTVAKTCYDIVEAKSSIPESRVPSPESLSQHFIAFIAHTRYLL